MATTNERSDLDFIAELEKYIRNRDHKEILENDSFYYEEAREAFKNFKEFGKDKEASFYKNEIKRFKAYTNIEKSKGKTKYENFLLSLNEDSEEFRIFELMGKLLAHFFSNAANIKAWNRSGDTFAKAQPNEAWVATLLQYKEFGNDFSKLKPFLPSEDHFQDSLSPAFLDKTSTLSATIKDA